ncbi:hypothetical protein [Spirilliplanes yamanashiensis]|uniref:SHOCT domain-containing protein n=1 Tax=Spirilliplanes yamanashiensis TaxID=42233 RepID=A0A8J3Y5M7_9ACTN|nr:hypothetical protein [Spirilliplanes yamanashiensis]MDP9819264.1 pyruvate/2-oxoglutarate dehydrogenase complex dihydrolipoamide acyltransferase (E2) component [Spirilliplanes yamanashiensis]GIJ01912.1 hypothetical protein Sya03_12640 [Spirilliplanes yamanashiensis]
MEKPTRRTSLLVALGVAGAAGAATLALIGTPALAEQAPTPAPSSSAAAPPAPADRQDAFAEALAAELGIDKAKVAAALEKVRAEAKAARPDRGDAGQTAEERRAARIAALKTRLDAAVAAGTITAEESAAVLKAAEAGVFPQGGGRGGAGGPGGPGGHGGPR